MRKAAWFCIPFAAAVALCRLLLPYSAAPLAFLCCCVLFLAGFLFRDRRRLAVFLLAGGMALGCGSVWCQYRFVMIPAEELVGERRAVSARVADHPDVYDGSAYVTVLLTEPGVPRIKCRLSSYYDGELNALLPGDEITAEVRFVSALVRSGEEIDTYTAQNVFIRAVCTAEPMLMGRWGLSFLYWPKTLSQKVGELCRRTFPDDAAPFMKALLTGDKSDLYEDSDRYYALGEAGLSHVVAVSGMHISYLVGLVFLLGGRRRSTSLVAIPLLLVFAAMTGFTPSVTRAVFMQICLLYAPLFRREEDSVTSLSVVLALLLLINPSAVAGAGLQLSFASMAGIYLISPNIYKWLWEIISGWKLSEYKIFRRGFGFAAVTVSAGLGAQVFSLPIAAANFGYVSTVAPLSGMLCLWMISLLFALGYAAVAAAAILPAVGAAVGGVLAWGVRYVFLVVRGLRQFPCEAVYMSNPLFVLWLIFVYVLFLTSWLVGRKGKTFRFVMPVCLSLIALWCCAGIVRLTWDEDLRVTALDVGQGECVVLTCGARSAMVDCGGTYMTRDAGENAVKFMGGQQRRHLDALILTHLHSDHVNGAARVLQQLDVDTLYLPLQADEDGSLFELLSAAAEAGTAVEFVTENMTLGIGDMELTVWAPLLPGDENENCLIVMARQGKFEAFITGDSLSLAEQILSRRYVLPDAELLIVGHHGSDTSTCDEFLRAIRPDLAVISVGYNNYGHPSAAVLDRLAEYGILVLRTDLEGNITVEAGG